MGWPNWVHPWEQTLHTSPGCNAHPGPNPTYPHAPVLLLGDHKKRRLFPPSTSNKNRGDRDQKEDRQGERERGLSIKWGESGNKSERKTPKIQREREGREAVDIVALASGSSHP